MPFILAKLKNKLFDPDIEIYFSKIIDCMNKIVGVELTKNVGDNI